MADDLHSLLFPSSYVLASHWQAHHGTCSGHFAGKAAGPCSSLSAIQLGVDELSLFRTLIMTAQRSSVQLVNRSTRISVSCFTFAANGGSIRTFVFSVTLLIDGRALRRVICKNSLAIEARRRLGGSVKRGKRSKWSGCIVWINGPDLVLIQVCKFDKLPTLTGVPERGKRDHDCVLAVATAGCNPRSWTLSDVSGGSGKLCINSAVLVVPWPSPV
ncbi:hypothetical protein KC361_g170 [Hortaea werneckii]|nr:hypothetical protein KC361_g170 [Hortaea werneckii]